ncbi:MAG: hypothetical protein IPL52_05430 [Flavobacteriales bacterium]|nr:hypothetical protein [Flavobacteriales bacterium]
MIGALQSDALAYRAGTEAASTTFDGSFANALNADEDYVITLTSYGSPVTWANSFTVDGVAQSNPATSPSPAAELSTWM